MISNFLVYLYTNSTNLKITKKIISILFLIIRNNLILSYKLLIPSYQKITVWFINYYYNQLIIYENHRIFNNLFYYLGDIIKFIFKTIIMIIIKLYYHIPSFFILLIYFIFLFSLIFYPVFYLNDQSINLIQCQIYLFQFWQLGVGWIMRRIPLLLTHQVC